MLPVTGYQGFLVIITTFPFLSEISVQTRGKWTFFFWTKLLFCFPRGINKKQRVKSHLCLVYSQRNTSVYMDTISLSFAREKIRKSIVSGWFQKKNHTMRKHTREYMICLLFTNNHVKLIPQRIIILKNCNMKQNLTEIVTFDPQLMSDIFLPVLLLYVFLCCPSYSKMQVPVMSSPGRMET